VKNGSASFTGAAMKNVIGGGGALLEYKKTRLLSNKTLDQTRPGVPSGTVADIYIYIHI
jgi:hypothetical protein